MDQTFYILDAAMLHLYVPVTVLVTLNVTVATTRWVKSATPLYTQIRKNCANNDCLPKLVESND